MGAGTQRGVGARRLLGMLALLLDALARLQLAADAVGREGDDERQDDRGDTVEPDLLVVAQVEPDEDPVPMRLRGRSGTPR